MDARARKKLAEYQQKLREKKQEELVAALEQYVAGWEKRLATDEKAEQLIDELLGLLRQRRPKLQEVKQLVESHKRFQEATKVATEIVEKFTEIANKLEETEMNGTNEDKVFTGYNYNALPPRDEEGRLIPLRDRAVLLAEKAMLDYLLTVKRVPLEKFGQKNEQERLVIDRLQKLGFVKLERRTIGCEGLQGYELAKALMKQDVVMNPLWLAGREIGGKIDNKVMEILES